MRAPGHAERVAGIDEVGRGPLAGPVIAAAVVLSSDSDWSHLRDSKRLSVKRRHALTDEIKAKASAWAIGEASVEEIDQLNIRQASLLAMKRAFEGLDPRADEALVDGQDLPDLACPAQAVIGGDATVLCISAASIIAKVHRDEAMLGLHKAYPVYGFDQHMGYPTAMHREQLRLHGPSDAHRRSFKPVRDL
ncbi:ribonuclease HII [Spiribacter salinus M19-40]|uniref:Ribonuclease HII n=1 Tax=Spiribacter salinus M19-40 TaxID=1260251 RepID=R4V7J5_9GAMM|nr:ribonuclease HII [Spiribacter salinus]AGM40980.1 ribonuclease HII [Spiribacter salinus M19-40]